MLTATRNIVDEFASLQGRAAAAPVASTRAPEIRVLEIGRDLRLHHVKFDREGARLAVGCEDGRAWLCDLVGGRRRSFLLNPRMSVRSVAFTGDGGSLALAGGNWLLREGELVLWPIGPSGTPTTLWRHNRPVTALAATSDGQRLAAGSGDGILRCWDSGFTKAKASIQAHDDEITAMAYARNEQFLITAGADRTVKIWDRQLRPVRTLKGHERVVRGVTCSSDQQWIASADEQAILIWDLETGQIVNRRAAPCGVFRDIVFSPGSPSLLTAGNSLHSPSEVRLWRDQHAAGKIVIRHRSNLTSLAIAPDGAILALADDRGNVHLWSRSASEGD